MVKKRLVVAVILLYINSIEPLILDICMLIYYEQERTNLRADDNELFDPPAVLGLLIAILFWKRKGVVTKGWNPSTILHILVYWVLRDSDVWGRDGTNYC